MPGCHNTSATLRMIAVPFRIHGWDENEVWTLQLLSTSSKGLYKLGPTFNNGRETFDSKNFQQSQTESTPGSPLEKRVHEIECEIDKLRKKVAELEIGRDRYQPKEQTQPKKTYSAECEISRVRKRVAELERERERYQHKTERPPDKTQLKNIPEARVTASKIKESQPSHGTYVTGNKSCVGVKERVSILKPSSSRSAAERYTSEMHLTLDLGGHFREKKTPQRVASFPDVSSLSGGQVRQKTTERRAPSSLDDSFVSEENEEYSVVKDEDSTLQSSGGKSWLIGNEHYEPAVYLNIDFGGGHVREKKTPPRVASFSDVSSVAGYQNGTTDTVNQQERIIFYQKAEPFSGNSSTERLTTEQKSASVWSLTDVASTQNIVTPKAMPRKTPLGSKHHDGITFSEEPHLLQAIKTRVSKDNGKAIHGLAILDDELFIITEGSSEIEVYETKAYTLVRCVTLKMLDAPWDIVACRINACLYIMNRTEGKPKIIIRIDQHGNVIRHWSTGDYCGRLSITKDSTVFLAVNEACRLIEYSADGQLLREIRLSHKLANVQHAIKLNIGKSLAIHGMSNDAQQRLCLLDTTSGCVLTSFGGQKGSDTEHLDGPVYLAVDKAGSIFISEHANRRILLLSRSFKIMRVLLSKEKHGLRFPWSIHLDEEHGRLFLVDNNYEDRQRLLTDGRVLVFQIS